MTRPLIRTPHITQRASGFRVAFERLEQRDLPSAAALGLLIAPGLNAAHEAKVELSLTHPGGANHSSSVALERSVGLAAASTTKLHGRQDVPARQAFGLEIAAQAIRTHMGAHARVILGNNLPPAAAAPNAGGDGGAGSSPDGLTEPTRPGQAGSGTDAPSPPTRPGQASPGADVASPPAIPIGAAPGSDVPSPGPIPIAAGGNSGSSTAQETTTPASSESSAPASAAAASNSIDGTATTGAERRAGSGGRIAGPDLPSVAIPPASASPLLGVTTIGLLSLSDIPVESNDNALRLLPIRLAAADSEPSLTSPADRSTTESQLPLNETSFIIGDEETLWQTDEEQLLNELLRALEENSAPEQGDTENPVPFRRVPEQVPDRVEPMPQEALLEYYTEVASTPPAPLASLDDDGASRTLALLPLVLGFAAWQATSRSDARRQSPALRAPRHRR
jgi:hypothetical protein